MLIGLGIRDVVLIESLDLSFGPGLLALTGETGAGKSIILDALGLALGARVDAALVRRRAATPSGPTSTRRASTTPATRTWSCAAPSPPTAAAAPSSTTRRPASASC